MPDGLWQDQAFDYDPLLVKATRQSIFELDPQLDAALRDPAIANAPTPKRLEKLLLLVFGPDMKVFSYAGGRTTTAAETWRNRQGDCLSLTILSQSLARRLNVTAQMQEVRVPVSFDRRYGVDFLNNHVNLVVRNHQRLELKQRSLPAGEIVIDFEPQVGSTQRGEPLGDDAIVARYYNNVAAEKLAVGHDRSAYAHFKAAILADPRYAASYNNLAQLYLRANLVPSAERLLRHAIALNNESPLALSSLQRLLQSQGRSIEAEAIAQRLYAQRAKDPYHWLGVGLQHLREQQYAEAVDALERAQNLTRGFDEVHRYLAVAYWRNGQHEAAQAQLARLTELNRDDPAIGKLNKKFSSLNAAPPVR
ncbi:MAG: tetratricopeptide repeat protein [Rubrivivax sp.]